MHGRNYILPSLTGTAYNQITDAEKETKRPMLDLNTRNSAIWAVKWGPSSGGIMAVSTDDQRLLKPMISHLALESENSSHRKVHV